MKRLITAIIVFAGLILFSGVFPASAQQASQKALQLKEQQGEIYGSEIMSEQERHEYARRIREAQTPQEEEQYRLEHRQQMRERAEKLGVTLPQDPRGPEGPMKPAPSPSYGPGSGGSDQNKGAGNAAGGGSGKGGK